MRSRSRVALHESSRAARYRTAPKERRTVTTCEAKTAKRSKRNPCMAFHQLFSAPTGRRNSTAAPTLPTNAIDRSATPPSANIHSGTRQQRSETRRLGRRSNQLECRVRRRCRIRPVADDVIVERPASQFTRSGQFPKKIGIQNPILHDLQLIRRLRRKHPRRRQHRYQTEFAGRSRRDDRSTGEVSDRVCQRTFVHDVSRKIV